MEEVNFYSFMPQFVKHYEGCVFLSLLLLAITHMFLSSLVKHATCIESTKFPLICPHDSWLMSWVCRRTKNSLVPWFPSIFYQRQAMEHHTCWRLTKTRSTQHAAIGAAGDIGLSSFSRKYTKEIETNSRCSIVVSIPACHAGDPGSIPGNGVLFCSCLLF